MEKNYHLNPPKKEEELEEEENPGQVPDTYNTEAPPDEHGIVIDELEGLVGIGDDESLPVDWEEEEFSTTQLFQDAELWCGGGSCYDVAVKAENSYTYWDFDDKKGASLNLSLNYQEVLDAWSNRGPLWVPSNSIYMGEVPIMEVEKGMSSRRQASVMRYKEKRQSRLFSKKIRYEVRKLNADKRPRVKGRFVKRFGW